MRVVIINKSDATGGAAVVSLRLMEALRQEGIDAQMLVCEKLTDSPYVHLAAPHKIIKWKFLLERLKVFIANGFNRDTLFKIDTGEEGLSLWEHPLVRNCDAILVNWVNQGMLSLRGIKKISVLGKPLIWTMHDMWCMTGICHHAGTCQNFKKDCGNCPLLGKKSTADDLSHKILEKKKILYTLPIWLQKTAFVAVSNWLKEKSIESSLLKKQRVEVIPNAFNLEEAENRIRKKDQDQKVRILFGAARIDDPIKGLDTLRVTSDFLKRNYPELASRMEIAVFGNVKDQAALQGFSLLLRYLGVLGGDAVKKAYQESDIVVSASSYETLPGTLVEAQAYGCLPVSFNQGGQTDIIDHLSTGYIAEYNSDIRKRAENLAKGIVWGAYLITKSPEYGQLIQKMRNSVIEKFSYHKVAREYISLINDLNLQGNGT